jgi:hypothetical protein
VFGFPNENSYPLFTKKLVDSQTKCDTGYVRDRHGTDIQPPQP